MPHRSAASSPREVNMSSVDRLAMSKERSKGMELIGYTLLERLKEMRDIMRIKEARMERLQQMTREEHNLQEKVIMLLRKEIKLKEIIIIKAGDFEQQKVSRVLKYERRPRLQLRSSDVKGAVYALDEWFAFQKNLLNLVRCTQRKRVKYLDRKHKEIEYLDHISSDVDEVTVRKSVRQYENNIAKLKVKYRTAQQLQTSYHNILDKYHQESLLLGYRLETTEKALRMHYMELRDLMEMKGEIDVTLNHTLKHLPKTEHAVQHASTERKAIEAATRKRERDLRVEKLLSKQRRRSDRMDEDGVGTVAEMIQREDDTTEMLERQLDIDTIKSLTSAADTNAILEAFVKQSVVHDDVSDLKRQKENERKLLVEELERLKADRQRRTFDEQNVVSRGKKLEEEMRQRIVDEEKELERKMALLTSRGDILFQVNKGVTSIFEKLAASHEQGVISVNRALFTVRPDPAAAAARGGSVGSVVRGVGGVGGVVGGVGGVGGGGRSPTLNRLFSCQRVLTALVNQLESSDNYNREGILTDCLLFGEMVDDHLDLLIPAGSRLSPRKEADALQDYEYDQKENSGVLTREEMKKQHKKFYDLRKIRATHNRSSKI